MASEPAPHIAAIALGSNLPSNYGAPAQNLEEAVRRFAAIGRVIAVSTFHSTAPIGYLDQPDFLNAAAILDTTLGPFEFMRALLTIEAAMGRDRAAAPPKGPRIIDLDLLLYDELTMGTPELTLPHPAMRERRFVLAPLAEIAPNWSHPVTGETIHDMLAKLEP